MVDRTIDVQSVQRVYTGFQCVDRVEVRYQRPDGSMSDLVERSSVERGDAVGILVYARSQDAFVFVRQFRYPTLRHSDPWPIEIVAGAIDPGEIDWEAARREMKEEIGVETSEWVRLGEIYSTPGGCSEMVTLFVAELENYEKPTGLGGLEGEDIEVFMISRQEAFGLVESGTIRDAKTLVAMLRFAALRAR